MIGFVERWLRWALTRHYPGRKEFPQKAICGEVGGRFADRPQHVTCPKCIDNLRRGGMRI